MPVKVRKGDKDCPWEIYEVSTGKRKGCSKTREDAEASARIRNAAIGSKAMDGAMETKSFGGHIVEVKQSERNGVAVGIVEGYLAAWTPDRGGRFGMPDRFIKGAFLDSIAEHKARDNRQIRLRDNHGRTVGGFPIDTVFEDDFGLRATGEINLEVQQGKEIYSLARQRVVTDFSIGFIAQEDKINTVAGTRDIFKAMIMEGSMADEPINVNAQILSVKSIVPFQNLDIAERMYGWDCKSAIDRVREFTDSSQHPSDDYKRAFVWVDPDKQDDFDAYRIPIADVIDDNLKAVPRGVFEAGMGLHHSKIVIPEDDAPAAINHLERYYAKMGLISPFADEAHFFNNEEVKCFDRRKLERALVSTGAFSQKAAKILAARYNEPSNREIVDVLRTIRL